MQPLTGAQRRYLRGQGSLIKPHVHIGKNGLIEPVVKAIDEALDDHELIKIRFLEFKEEKTDLSAEIARMCNCHLVGVVGHIALFFRQNSDPLKRKISLL